METVVSQVVPLWQAQTLASDAIKQNNELHEQGIQQADLHNKQQMKLGTMLHKRDQALARELHFAQMSHDMQLARREGIRDVWSQRNQLTQTLMIVDTLMFGCAFAMIVEGNLPETGTHSIVITVYSALLGVSLSCLFISIWFSLNLQARMARYDMHREYIQYIPCMKRHSDFNDYYACHCLHVEKWSLWAFYLGTSSTISAAAVLMAGKFFYSFGCLEAACIFGVIASLSIFLILLGPMVWPEATHAGSTDVMGLGADAQVVHRATAEEQSAAKEYLASGSLMGMDLGGNKGGKGSSNLDAVSSGNGGNSGGSANDGEATSLAVELASPRRGSSNVNHEASHRSGRVMSVDDGDDAAQTSLVWEYRQASGSLKRRTGGREEATSISSS